MALTLYHWEPNANSGKPILAMEEKELDFDSHYLDLLNFDQHEPDYLRINPLGTIPALVHDDRMLNESTAIMEYVDAAFRGPSLRPSDSEERWRMRWWMKFLDEYYAPSASMMGWNAFIGPSVRDKDPDLLKAKIDAIPQPERQVAWRKAIYGLFTEEELAESARRVAEGARLFEENLKRHRWIAGETFSLADINAMNLVYFMPANPNGAVGPDKTPYTMEWLYKMAERPATQRAWSRGKTMTADRLTHLVRPTVEA